ncbi:MAG: Cell wall lytic activity [Candidatus Nomurabacteria bacterium GW2011_GWF2_43_8]|uniref:Cell wall lytic activity n=3 Tax=Candidatus Nomuraibacteriota TaxID=1752729 RepID=A0A0G1FPE1_9BACT|nr:MAG: Cell wall lytic activity [Candidatus Nomurabacteria bacterium GW2011_GWA2_43_15]KKT18282.1 MAG: Cell wall lytic activity [Candidatus Nomurabacteria bacterium GW2011_GWB1_43_7]KKT24361.1 MAG: Cell wall lytic activity [Candidatus Nomurabacteria bacterium GW2011_GWF2_43_8]
MSNLLKSKFLLGVLVVTVLVVGGVAFLADTASADCTITSTLRAGSTGTEVQCLQSIVGASADGKFGPMTQAAVMAWQSGHGLVADGVVGPLTRAAMMGAPTGNFPAGCTSAAGYSSTTGVKCDSGPSTGLPAGCSSTAGYSPLTGAKCDSSTPAPSGALEGGAGSITVDGLSDFSGEEVGEGQDDVEVLTFEVEADDESDVDVTSIKVELNQQNTADSEDMDDYMESVSVWMGGEMVGEADVENFSESTGHVWSKTISLDGAVIEAGEAEEFTLAVTAANSIDSSDRDSDDWQIGVSSVRFLDAEGVTTTESVTLDIDDDTVDEEVEQRFDFTSSSAASDLELKVSLSDDDDINEAHVLNIDDTDDTTGVEVLSFEIEIEGDSDVTIDEIPVEITTVGMNIDDSISKVTLFADGDKIDSKGVTATDTDETITFNELDFMIEAGDTVLFTVEVDINDLDATAGAEVANGDSIQAQITATERALIDAEDESGDDVATGDMTGTAIGEASIIYDAGISVVVVSKSTEVSTVDAQPDTVQFTWVLDVTAFDANAYITSEVANIVATADDSATEVNVLYTDDSSVASQLEDFTETITSSADTVTGDAGAYGAEYNGDVLYQIDDGDTERFTITVSAENDAAGAEGVVNSVSAFLSSLQWTTDDVTATTLDASTAVMNGYTFNMEDNTQTPVKTAK